MQGNNLNIDIAVNSDKAQADLALLKAQLRATNKEVKQLGDAGVKAGNAMPSQELQDATQRAGRLNREINSLNRSLAQTGDVATATGNKLAFSARGFRSLNSAVFNLGRQFGGIGIAAFGAFQAFGAIAEKIDDVNKALTDLREQSRQKLLDPAAIKAAQQIGAKAGVAAQDIQNILSGPAEAFAKLRTEAGKPINTSGVTVLRGSLDDTANAAKRTANELANGVTVLRGEKGPVFDLAHAYDMLGIQEQKYKGSAKDNLRRTLDTIIAFQKLASQGRLTEVQLNELSKALFKGTPAGTVLQAAPTLISDLAQQIIKVQGPLAEHEKNLQALEQSRGRLKAVLDSQWEDIADFYNRNTTAINEWRANVLESLFSAKFWQGAWDGFKTGLDQFFASLKAEFAQAWADTLKLINFDSLLTMAQQAFAGIVNFALDAAAKVAQAFSSIGSALGGGGAGPVPGGELLPQFAGGGSVRGPGSATSDSILARLSNGEFVMRARAVDHWGPRFMAALNAMQNPFGYHAGGLVTPRFADGGLVAAGGGSGRAVHLHLGGSEFALSGASNVVDALVTEASRQRMRSGGLKPSWYGGRVSG